MRKSQWAPFDFSKELADNFVFKGTPPDDGGIPIFHHAFNGNDLEIMIQVGGKVILAVDQTQGFPQTQHAQDIGPVEIDIDKPDGKAPAG